MSGNSDPCTGQRNISDYVNEVDQLLTKLNIDRPFVYVSHSLGGVTARNFAAKYKGDVAALLMIDPANPRDVDIVTEPNPSGGQDEIDAIKKNDYAMGEGKWCFLDVIWDKSEAVGFSEIGDIPVTLIAEVLRWQNNRQMRLRRREVVNCGAVCSKRAGESVPTR